MLIVRYHSDEGEFYNYRNKWMKEMLKNMKKSLKEELGSVDKTNV